MLEATASVSIDYWVFNRLLGVIINNFLLYFRLICYRFVTKSYDCKHLYTITIIIKLLMRLYSNRQTRLIILRAPRRTTSHTFEKVGNKSNKRADKFIGASC